MELEEERKSRDQLIREQQKKIENLSAVSLSDREKNGSQVRTPLIIFGFFLIETSDSITFCWVQVFSDSFISPYSCGRCSAIQYSKY